MHGGREDRPSGFTGNTRHRAGLEGSANLILGWRAWLTLVALLVLARLVPYFVPRVVERCLGVDGQALTFYLFNVTPLGAACVFSGAVFASPVQALAFPIAVWAISDMLLTWTGWAPVSSWGHFLVQYPLFTFMSVLGLAWVRQRRSLMRMLGTCLASGVVFLLVVDFHTWLCSPDAPFLPTMPTSYWERLGFAFRPDAFLHIQGYPKTLDGLVTCYLMGLPFSLRFVGSTVVFGLAFFAAYAWLEKRSALSVSWRQSVVTLSSR